MFFVHGPSKDSVFTCTMLKLSQVIHLPRDISYHTLTWRGSYIYIYTNPTFERESQVTYPTCTWFHARPTEFVWWLTSNDIIICMVLHLLALGATHSTLKSNLCRFVLLKFETFLFRNFHQKNPRNILVSGDFCHPISPYATPNQLSPPDHSRATGRKFLRPGTRLVEVKFEPTTWAKRADRSM